MCTCHVLAEKRPNILAFRGVLCRLFVLYTLENGPRKTFTNAKLTRRFRLKDGKRTASEMRLYGCAKLQP